MSTKTPKKVADTATQQGVLKRGQLTLIGIAGAGSDRRVLFRTSTGHIVTAEPGKPSRVGTIVGIADDRVVLRRSGRDVTLTLPN
ncbi:pilus assembly protein PilZ [Shimia biformata]|uniref:pilus assembly protein PilZ n=1 Tax=Shimia biformata TaxID=1294299 RepID=UPI00194EB79E|nr:pilus assembly protein PilZ [Shimia biformata]